MIMNYSLLDNQTLLNRLEEKKREFEEASIAGAPHTELNEIYKELKELHLQNNLNRIKENLDKQELA